MAISITPITSTVTTVAPLICDSLQIVNLLINGKNVVSPSINMAVLPYASNNGTPIFASENEKQTFQSSNLYGVIANVPEVGEALQAVEVAAQALVVYTLARQVDIVTAQTNLTTTQTNVANAQNAVSTAQTAVGNAQAALNSATNDTRVALTEALVAAQTNLSTVQGVLATARTSVQTAQTNLSVANMAARDAANPKVVFS